MPFDIGALHNSSDVWFAIGSRGADGGDVGKAKAHLAVPSFDGELRPRQQVVQPQDAVAIDSEGAAAGQAGLGIAEPDQVVLCDSTVLTNVSKLSASTKAFQLTSCHALASITLKRSRPKMQAFVGVRNFLCSSLTHVGVWLVWFIDSCLRLAGYLSLMC